MTEFGKARPRLYDELNSSHLTIHGDTNGAIAAGLAIINIAPTFISPTRNHWTIGTQATEVNRHDQPSDAASVIAKILQLKRRSKPGEEGFDALGIIVVECANDGSPILLRQSVQEYLDTLDEAAWGAASEAEPKISLAPPPLRSARERSRDMLS